MRITILSLLILFISSLHCQNEVLIGSAISNSNNVLVIHNNEASLNKLKTLTNYTSVEGIKLVAFKDDETLLDSTLKQLFSLTSVKKIIFSNCNLLFLTADLRNFTKLEEIRVVDQSEFFENSLFPLLKANQIKDLYLEMPEPDVITDSIALLVSLERIHITNLDFKQQPLNYSQFKDSINNKLVQLIEYADYKPLSTKRDDLAAENHSNSSQFKFDCIKQPIPGININDTSYTFNSINGASFQYYSGSTISIDKNAFTYENGKEYQGSVRIFYREFRNPVEIMLSGIPMTNSDNGEQKLFKSGGMYQIEAYDSNNKSLITKSDTSVKINFALTDTSANFKFYSLNNNGSWSVKSNSIVTTQNNQNNLNIKASKAAIAYLGLLKDLQKEQADTTRFNTRFVSNTYLYTMRKDNMIKKSDSSLAFYMDGKGLLGRRNNTIKTKALFKIKYLKRTKDKEIVFTIMPAKKNLRLPYYINALVNKTMVYTGELDLAQFRKKYCQKVMCWDLRNTSTGNSIDLNVKTNKGFLELSGMIVKLNDDGTYKVVPRVNHITNVYMTRQVRIEAYRFDTRKRFNYTDGNSTNPRRNIDFEKIKQMAYDGCKKLKTEKELKMNVTQFHKYAYTINGLNDWDLGDNEVGNALVKSGLGIKNIDCYIHSGQMEDILVRYDNYVIDSLIGQHNVMLYKSINTSFPLTVNIMKQSLSGYYFKKNKNYVIRFSDNGYMQVTKPTEVAAAKNGNSINLPYTNQYLVKGLNSNDITRLIFD